MITKLCFNATDDVSNVGAWVRAGTDGDRIGSQTYNTEEWLNVAAILTDSSGNELGTTGNPLAVDIQDASISVDLDHTEDSVRLGDGTSFFTSTTVGADLGLDVNIINTSLVVSATDLDIRDLSFATDSVDVSGSSVSITGDVNVTQGTSPWVVSATDLDIRDLSAATDSVAAWTHDGTGNAITSSGGALDVNLQSSDINLTVDDTANTACATSATSVDNTAGGTDLVGTDLANRKYMFIHNNGNQTVYIGESGVTAASGFPVEPCSRLELRAGASCDLHAISATAAAQDIRVLELS